MYIYTQLYVDIALDDHLVEHVLCTINSVHVSVKKAQCFQTSPSDCQPVVAHS